MKFLGKKGQGAMEYLMTYGWAILVVMIVGVVLWQLGIFNLGGQTKTMTGFGAVKPIDWRMTETLGADDDQIIIVNGEGVAITLQSVALGSPCSGTFATTDTVKNGASQSITGSCAAGTAGSGYDIPVTISYTKMLGATTMTHTSVGHIIGVWE